MQSPKIIPRLDLMIAYSCNISCRGCISLSDFKRDGVANIKDINSWVVHWKSLIEPRVVTLFGGEPCLHPHLLTVCEIVRTAWPNTVIRLITNGYLLDNFDNSAWFKFAPMEIQVSVHRKDHEHIINHAIKEILKNSTEWKVTQGTGERNHRQMIWALDGFKIYKSIFKDFVVPFKQVEQKILPWMSNPAAAHSICGAPDTPVLYKGRLYKCPAVANAIDLADANWLNYEPCADASTLDQFIAGIGKPESVCAQCPDSTQAVVVDHMDKNNVIVKQNIS